MKKEYTYIDLFAGAGGFSLGFDQERFKNVLSIEFNEKFSKTYKYNFPFHNLIIDDIKNISNKEIRKFIKYESVDVIVGGPPCQGFSLAGNIGRNFIDDDRNQLFREFVRFVSICKPKVFIMENVGAMATHMKGKTIKDIVYSLEHISNKSKKDYKVKWKILNSVNYGIPQQRRRIFIVGVRNDLEKEFDFPIKDEEIISIKEAIKDLPKLNSGEQSLIPNHNAMNHSKQMLEKMKYIEDGGDRRSIPKKIRPTSGDIRKYIRYKSDSPSICITGDMRKVFHYEQNRALTIRELARIQTFPDEFIFIGNSGDIQQQIGNAVPPKLSRQLASKVKEVLEYEYLS